MNIYKENKKRCIIALILCCLVVISSLTAVFYRLTTIDYDDYYFGIENFRYFTYITNLLAGFSAMLCIPFQIDGLRYNNYHLPRWIVNILFIATCIASIVFTVCLFLFIPTVGIYQAFIRMPTPFAHLLTPLLFITTFIFINDDHQIKLKMIFISLIPPLIYITIYTYEVFIVGKWIDHYQTNTYMPFWLAYILMCFLTIGVAFALRYLHNKRHAKRKKEIYDYYSNLPYQTIQEAISFLAKEAVQIEEKADINVPRRILLLLEDKYHSGLSLNELCNIYINEYLNNKSKEDN